MYLKKVLENTPSYGCRMLDSGKVYRRSMHPKVDHFKPSYPVERSRIDNFDPGHGQIELEVGLSEPRSFTCASEAIRFGC
jgi:hypothetical protein